VSTLGRLEVAAGEGALAYLDVSHRFGAVHALDHFDLVLGQGEFLCLLGPSGCGKTTALRLAAGLEDLQTGRIAMAGRTIAEPGRSVPPEARRIGLVFQDFALFPHLSVRRNVAFGLRGQPHGVQERRVDEVLGLVEMSPWAEAYPHMLSGGQQQRVALARALAPEPALLLLDEPFSGLDTTLRAEVREATRRALERSGTTSLMVTHDPEEAMFMAERIALMRAGRLVQVGAPEELWLRPADAFVASFFGEVNRFSGRIQQGQVATPLGALPAAGLAEGRAAVALVRPEGLRLVEGGIGATVVERRLLGAVTLVRLRLADGGAATARLPGAVPLAAGERVGLAVDPAQAFVFPES